MSYVSEVVAKHVGWPTVHAAISDPHLAPAAEAIYSSLTKVGCDSPANLCHPSYVSE